VGHIVVFGDAVPSVREAVVFGRSVEVSQRGGSFAAWSHTPVRNVLL